MDVRAAAHIEQGELYALIQGKSGQWWAAPFNARGTIAGVDLLPEAAADLGLVKPETKPKPEEKETPEDIKKRSRKPPAEGPCKRCGLDKPINRLMLCYSCWVKTNLEKDGWREGQPHPSTCGCDTECAAEKKNWGN